MHFQSTTGRQIITSNVSLEAESNLGVLCKFNGHSWGLWSGFWDLFCKLNDSLSLKHYTLFIGEATSSSGFL